MIDCRSRQGLPSARAPDPGAARRVPFKEPCSFTYAYDQNGGSLICTYDNRAGCSYAYNDASAAHHYACNDGLISGNGYEGAETLVRAWSSRSTTRRAVGAGRWARTACGTRVRLRDRAARKVSAQSGYMAFGARINLPVGGGSSPDPARTDPSFQNRSYDAGVGIYDYRNRCFDPATGRFLQRDPVLGGDELFNPYCFPGNNPVTNADPMGETIVANSKEESDDLARRLKRIADDAGLKTEILTFVDKDTGKQVYMHYIRVSDRSLIGLHLGEMTTDLHAAISRLAFENKMVKGGAGRLAFKDYDRKQLLLFATSPSDSATYKADGAGGYTLTPFAVQFGQRVKAGGKGFMARLKSMGRGSTSMCRLGIEVPRVPDYELQALQGIPIAGPLAVGTTLEEFGLKLEASGQYGGATMDAAALVVMYYVGKGMSVAVAKQLAGPSARTLALEYAAAVRNLEDAPGTVAVYKGSGPSPRILFGRSGGRKALVGSVEWLLEEVPESKQRIYHGKCAEIDLMNQALRLGEDVEGGTVATAKVRAPGKKGHGASHDPCPSCEHVLSELGVQYEDE